MDYFRQLRLCLVATLFMGMVRHAAAEADFLRDVRPILSSHCFKCHGPDPDARKAKLRLDLPDEALKPAKSGELPIVPQHPEKSELVRRIFATDEDDLMPPPAAKIPLNDKEKNILREWISNGAVYKPHWAFVKPKDAPLPTVTDPSWAHNGIDTLILAALEKRGLKPSPQADKHTLVRRLYLDLIGLPPTPKQADAFVQDASPDAYEHLVDSLLDSPHYGERWARRWLDLARYADTNGYEKDRPRSMWPWRDWVIKALNKDMPFDEFTREQLAGDLLPNATQDQIVATGFNRNTMINEEGGTDPLEFRFYSMVDRVHVTSTAWLGLTMACAQCHTHKFDPIQHDEYYQFMAFMNDCDEPVFEVSQPDIAAKRKTAQEKVSTMETALIDQFPAERNIEWLTPAAVNFVSENGADGERLDDGSIRVTGKNPEKDVYTISFGASLARVTHLQLEAIPDDSVGKGGPGRTDHGNFVLSEIELSVEADPNAEAKTRLRFSSAEADFSQDKFPVANAIDGKPDTGWAIGADSNKRPHRRAIFTLSKPLSLEATNKLTVRLVQQFGDHHTLGRFRISLGNEVNDGRPLEERQRENRDRQFAKWLGVKLPKAATWNSLAPSEAIGSAPTLDVESDNSIFASGDFTKSDTYKLKFLNIPVGATALRIEVLPDPRLPGGGPGRVHYEGESGDFLLSNLKVMSGRVPVTLTNATQSYAHDQETAAKAIDSDLQSGWSVRGAPGKANTAVFQFNQALTNNGDLEVEMTFERYYASALGKFRISISTNAHAEALGLPPVLEETLFKYQKNGGTNAILSSAVASEDRTQLLHQFAMMAPELASARREIDKVRNGMPKFPTTLVMTERSPMHPRVTHVHHRGEFLQPEQVVTPGVPSFLPPFPDGQPKNRLGLANWLVSDENPLTARVVMNRAWEAFFGRGIVRTVEDFGFQGDPPSNQELLDWLAIQFMKSGWSQKKMHKMIVMSAAYQQSSAVSRELLEKDPENLLVSRGPRFRVDAEMVRDLGLVASGLFSDKIGGPSVYPPQPPGVTTEGAYGALTWNVSEGGDRYRRGLYTFAKRTAPDAMTATFDGPSGEACLARRDRSDTPLQALTLMNDTVFLDCARALGKQAGDIEGSAEAKVSEIFRRILTRPPTDAEVKKLTGFYEGQVARFANGELKTADILEKGEGAGANEKAAWVTVARVLLNLDETITKE